MNCIPCSDDRYYLEAGLGCSRHSAFLVARKCDSSTDALSDRLARDNQNLQGSEQMDHRKIYEKYISSKINEARPLWRLT
jgi:hypothetical protein